MLKLLKAHIADQDTDKIVQLINQHPPVLDEQDENGSSGFMLLAYARLDKVLERAIEVKASFTFWEAIVAGKENSVAGFLESGQDELVHAISPDGFTPLSLAAFFDRDEIARLLINKGADPNQHATNPSQVNALHSAVARENYKLCELFIESGVDVNVTQAQNVTPLHSAVHRGNLQLTKLLVEKGASVDKAMDNGDTSLSIARREGHHEVLEYLIEQGR